MRKLSRLTPLRSSQRLGSAQRPRGAAQTLSTRSFSNGQITLTLMPGGQYAIDARCVLGHVYSDFEGRAQSRLLWGEEFDRPGTAPVTNLYLRVRFGDIMILNQHGPPAD